MGHETLKRSWSGTTKKKLQRHHKNEQDRAWYGRCFARHVYVKEETTNLFPSKFWFHNFEQQRQLVCLYYDSKSSPWFNCDSVTHVQIKYLERRFWNWENNAGLCKRNSCFCKYFKAGRTILIRSGFLSLRWF